MLNLLWLQSGGCGGCSMSLLNAESPDVLAMFKTAGINLLWHPSLSEASGREFISILDGILAGEVALDILCIEGSMMTGPAGTGRFHMMGGTGKPMIEWVQSLADKAAWTVAVGSCAAYGGITAAADNLTDATGLQFDGEQQGGLLGSEYRSQTGSKVVNIAGCPVHPEYKASAEQLGDRGCMMENTGCKGTQAHADCNIRPWNGQGSCTNGGYPCINCTAPEFEEPGHSFCKTPKIAGIPVGLPTDMPKAWFVALASLSKAATPDRLKENATSDQLIYPPTIYKRDK